MKRSLPFVLALLAVLPGAARAGDDAPPPAAAPAPAEARDGQLTARAFEGIWVFDAKRSDDPRKQMEQMGGRGRGPGGGPGGGMGPGGMPPGGGMGGGGRGEHGGMDRGGAGGPGGPPDGETPEDLGDGSGNSRGGGDPRRAMERVLHPAQKLVVYVDHDRFQVEEDEGAPRVYTIADSLKALGVKPLNDEATVRMTGHKLDAKQPLGRRGALLETFELSDDGRTLTIRARRLGGPEGMPNPEFKRVYTRYDGE